MTLAFQEQRTEVGKTQPGSVTTHKLEELVEVERKLLN